MGYSGCGDGCRMVAGGLWWMAKEEDLIWEIREGDEFICSVI